MGTQGRPGARSPRRQAISARLAQLPEEELLARCQRAHAKIALPTSTRWDLTKFEDLEAAFHQATGKRFDPYGEHAQRGETG